VGAPPSPLSLPLRYKLARGYGEVGAGAAGLAWPRGRSRTSFRSTVAGTVLSGCSGCGGAGTSLAGASLAEVSFAGWVVSASAT
jgi:hypothetical protein